MNKILNDYFIRKKNMIMRQLELAKKNVPFYKNAFKKIDLKKIKNYSDFCNLIPFIDSSEIIENPESFYTGFPYIHIRFSSSTTGNHKKIYLTQHDINHWSTSNRLSITPYFEAGMTVTHSKRKEKYYLSALDKSVLELNGKIMTFNPLKTSSIINCLKKADILFDYAELIYYISEKLKKLKINLNKKIIISYTGNKLEKLDIKKIKNNFKKIGCEVEIYSEYATSEMGPIGCSDNKENNLFSIIYDNNVFIEIIDPITKKNSKQGEVVATALNRTGTVFIRYKLGDLGILMFKNNQPHIKFLRRKKGIKIASVFFSPELVFRFIRNELNIPIFCQININVLKHKSEIKITVTHEKKLKKDFLKIKKKLLDKIEFIDDFGSTVDFKINYEKKKFNDGQIRKGFNLKIN